MLCILPNRKHYNGKKKKKIHLVILTLSCPVRGFHFFTLTPMSPYHAIHKHLDVCKRKS